MPAAGGANTRAKQKKVKRPQAPHGPGGTLLRTPKKKRVRAPAGDVSTGGGYNLKPAKKIERKRVKTRKVRQTQVKDVKSDRDLGTAKLYKQLDEYKDLQEKVKGKRLQRAFREHDVKTIERVSDAHAAAAVARSPVLKVLDQTTRPLHAVAAAAREDVKDVKAGKFPVGQGSLKAAKRGIQNKDKSTFSDVAKDLGVKNKYVAGAVGLVGDIALDPLTYATGGTSSAAKQAARSASRKAQREAVKSGATKASGKAAQTQALKRGLSPTEAKRVRKTAEKKTALRAGRKAGEKAAVGKQTNNGLSVRFAGHQIPGITRSTAAVKRAPRKVASKTKLDQTRVGAKVDRAQQSVRDAVRSTAAEVNPNIVPVGVERETYQSMRRAARTARAKTQRGDVYAALGAHSFRDRVGEDNYQRVLYAIEEGTVNGLPKPLRGEANRWIQRNKKRLKTEKRAGLKVGDVTDADKGVVDYVPQLRVDLDKTSKQQAGKGPGKVAPAFAKGRQAGTLREKNLKNPGRYSEDMGVIEATRASQSSRSLAKAEMNRSLAGVGRKLDKNYSARDQVSDGEAIYRVDGADLVRVPEKELRQSKTPKGQLVILNEKALERTAGTVSTAGSRSTPGVFFDKVQGVWKLGATVVNPGYYVRNIAGEAQNAYLAERPDKLIRNAVTSGKALKEVRKREEAARGGVKYEGGRHAELIDQAEKAGAIRAGQYAREIGQFLTGESKKHAGRKKGAGKLRGVGRVRDNVEDVFRLASFKGGLDRGLTPEHAAQRAARNHFDYADLSESERKVLRRVMPFYTFSARNIPLQIKSLVTRPGKFANYQKVREEFGKAFGFDESWESKLTEWEQRSAPIPVKWKGKEFTISLGPSGLPLTDLNEMPVSLRPDKAVDEWLSRAGSMVTPFIKTPVELWANFSFFFRDQLERDTSPLVPAPSWVGQMPAGFQKLTGYTEEYEDPRTHKKVPGWRAKADYIVNQVPGPAAFANRLSKESDRSGQSTAMKTLGYFGPRIREIPQVDAELNKLYDQRSRVQKQGAAMRQQGISAKNPTPAYRKFLKRQKDLTSKIDKLKADRGDAVDTPKIKKTPSSGGFFPESSGGGSSSPREGFFK